MTSGPFRRRSALRWLCGVLVVAAALAVALVARPRLDRELSGLPSPERRALYERTIETLRTACLRAPGPEVTEYCREQGDFIEHFPECDHDCRALAERFAQRPSR